MKREGQRLQDIDIAEVAPDALLLFSAFQSARLLLLEIAADDQVECEITFAKELSQLEELTLFGGVVTVEQIRQLEQHPTLKKICLNPSGDPQAWEESLLKIPHLEEVEFRNNRMAYDPRSIVSVEFQDLQKNLNAELKQRSTLPKN